MEILMLIREDKIHYFQMLTKKEIHKTIRPVLWLLLIIQAKFYLLLNMTQWKCKLIIKIWNFQLH